MLSKKLLVVLVIIAVILIGVSIGIKVLNSDKTVAISGSEGNIEDTGSGKLGIGIIPSVAEDKNDE